eukprot:gene8918-1598_t
MFAVDSRRPSVVPPSGIGGSTGTASSTAGPSRGRPDSSGSNGASKPPAVPARDSSLEAIPMVYDATPVSADHPGPPA